MLDKLISIRSSQI